MPTRRSRARRAVLAHQSALARIGIAALEREYRIKLPHVRRQVAETTRMLTRMTGKVDWRGR